MSRLPRKPRTAALVLALAASPFAACQCSSKQEAGPASSAPSTTGGSQAAPAPGDPASAQAAEITGAESLRRITELADTICACIDRACAETSRVALEEQNRKDAGRPRAKPTQAEADAMRDQAKRIADCVDKLK
jgi:hypothetical protein